MAISKKKKTNGKLTLINLKVDARQRALLLARARRYGAKSLSDWLRTAGLSYKPLGGLD